MDAAAKSAAGPRNPETSYGDTYTRQRVFLCLLPAHIRIMVAQVGLTSVRPVSVGAGIANPAWATTTFKRFATLVIALLTLWSANHVSIQIRGDLPYR